MLALAKQDLDGSERFGLRTHPHVKILSKFEVLGPRNGRGATWQNASLVKARERMVPVLDSPACALALSIFTKPYSINYTSRTVLRALNA